MSMISFGKPSQYVPLNGKNPFAPTIFYNLLTGQVPSGLTFSRASTGYYYNSSGVLTSASNNVARFDYNPSTLAQNGLLMEPVSQNSLLYSNTLNNAVWNQNTCSLATSVSYISPDGTGNGWALTDTTAVGTIHQLQQALTIVSGTTYTISGYFAPGILSWVFLDLYDGAADHGIYFNLSGNGSLGTSTGSATGTIQKVANGYYRCTVTATSGGTAGQWVAGSATGNLGRNYTGTGVGQTIYMYGTQLETLPFATSYISTVASTVTRAVDAFGSSSWTPYNAPAGTMIVEYTYGGFYPANGSHTLYLGDGGTNNRSLIYSSNAGTQILGLVVSGGSNSLAPTAVAASLSVGTYYRVGISYSANNFAAVALGGTVATSVSGAVPVITTAQLIFNDAIGTTAYFYGWIQYFKYWNKQLPNTKLKQLTQ